MTNSPERTTIERKRLQTFALHVCFLTLLFWAVPSLDSVYAYGFKATGNAAFGELGSNLRVEYGWVPPRERDSQDRESAMVGRVVGFERRAWEISYSVRNRGYEPTSVLLALILATPMSRRRRVVGSIAGFIALNAFILAQTGLIAASEFAAVDPDLISGGHWLGPGVRIAEAFFKQPIPRYATVFAVWALVAAPARGIDLNLGTIGERMRAFFADAASKSKDDQTGS